MSYDRIKELFRARFPTGQLERIDFRPNFNWYGHNACVTIESLDSAVATRELAYARLEEMIDFLRPHLELFGRSDRIQFTIALSESIDLYDRRILRGWIPAVSLPYVRPPDFAAVGGTLAEYDRWSAGVWFRSEQEFNSL